MRADGVMYLIFKTNCRVTGQNFHLSFVLFSKFIVVPRRRGRGVGSGFPKFIFHLVGLVGLHTEIQLPRLPASTLFWML